MLTFSLIILTSCTHSGAYKASVDLMTVEPVNVPYTLKFSALIKGNTEAGLSFESQGDLDENFVDVGEPVKVGQVLAKLSGGYEYQNLQSAELASINAQAQYEEVVEKMEAYLAQAENSLELARVNLEAQKTNLGNEENYTQSRLDELMLNIDYLNVQRENIEIMYAQNREGLLSTIETTIVQMRILSLEVFSYLYTINNLDMNHEQVRFKFDSKFITPQSLNSTERMVNQALSQFEDFEAKYQTYLQAATEEGLLNLLSEAVTLGESEVDLVYTLNEIFSSVIATSELSQTEIDIFSQTFFSFGSQMEMMLMNQNGGVYIGLKGLDQNLSMLDIQYESSMEELDKQIAIAEQQLTTLSEGNQSSVDVYQSNLDMAEVQYEQAQSALESAEAEKNLQIQIAKSNVDMTFSQKLIAEELYDKTLMRAPFDGVIVRRYHDEGKFLNPGEVLFELVDLSALKIQITVPGSYLDFIHVGDIARLELNSEEGADSEVEGGLLLAEVVHIPPALNRISGSALIELRIMDDPDLKPGTYVDVFFDTSLNQDILAVPEEALISIQDQTFVFLAVDEKASLKEVQRGMEFNGYIEILEGLESGDSIIINGIEDLSDGMLLQVLNVFPSDLKYEE